MSCLFGVFVCICFWCVFRFGWGFFGGFGFFFRKAHDESYKKPKPNGKWQFIKFLIRRWWDEGKVTGQVNCEVITAFCVISSPFSAINLINGKGATGQMGALQNLI